MLQVLIVGDGDSGRSTFLGLLYATQVKSGSDKSDNFRFHASPESLPGIALVFQQLMSGSFPDSSTKQGIKEMTFQLSSHRTWHGTLSALLRRRRGPRSPLTVRFTVLRDQVEEITRLLMGSSVVDETLNSIYECDAVVILVDTTKLAAKGETSQPGPLSLYDGGVESLLNMIQRLGGPRGRKRLHPIFVFTKFDRVSPDALRAGNVAAQLPGVDEIRQRAAYAEKLLGQTLPKTLARVKAAQAEGVRFARPAYFFSWMRTDGTTPGQPEKIQLRRTEDGGWEPDYSGHEYLAFMRYLGDIAVRSEE